MLQTKSEKAVALMSVITSGDEEASPAVMDQLMLERTARRESKSLIRSLAREMAQAEGQARLDAFRMQQAMRVGQATLAPAAEAIAEASEHGRLMAEKHPEIAPEIEEMTRELVGLLVQMPRVATVGYTSRYFKILQQGRDC